MSREIKFRGWLKDEKRIISFEEIGNEGYSHGGLSLKEHLENDDYILMQYTGLKDKNGKEIYESDIVRTVVETEYGKGNVDEEVYFGGGAFYPVSTQPDKTWEVIGNKFEGLQKSGEGDII